MQCLNQKRMHTVNHTEGKDSQNNKHTGPVTGLTENARRYGHEKCGGKIPHPVNVIVPCHIDALTKRGKDIAGIPESPVCFNSHGKVIC